MRELIHRYALWLLSVVLLCVAVAVKAEPLPDNDEWHFYAVTNCGSVVVFVWITPDDAFVAPTQGIRDQEALDQVIEARDRAMEDDNAYRIRMEPSGDCQRT